MAAEECTEKITAFKETVSRDFQNCLFFDTRTRSLGERALPQFNIVINVFPVLYKCDNLVV